MAEPTQAEVPALLAELKKYVMGGPVSNFVELNPTPSKLVTEGSLASELSGQLAPLIKDIKDIHQEVVNPLKVELLQQLGMDHLAAAVKKVTEGNPAAWLYFAGAVGGILVPIIGAALLLSAGNVLSGWFRNRMEASTGRILARDENQELRLQNRATVEQRERNVNGAGSIANLPSAASLEPLRAKLAEMTPVIDAFNKEAKKLPTGREISQISTALGKLDRAIRQVDAGVLRDTASGIRSLKGALKNFEPDRIPKAGPLKQTARASRDLSTATRDLAIRFRELGTAATAAAGQLA
ncbi:hypothetical protein AB0P12_31515 [Streptomyces subrutilus]|uniref:hypothetical protein n=1 Tax=Streptomyces subrutilus TaxID=36818 RepID=UPI003433FA2C